MTISSGSYRTAPPRRGCIQRRSQRAVNEVSKLKQKLNGEIQVAASFHLVHTLIEHDLVDELRLKIFPVVLGAGERLFGDTSVRKAMRLVDTRTFEDDVVILTYERTHDAQV